MTSIDPELDYSPQRLAEAREAVEKQCILMACEATEEEKLDAAYLLRAWWAHASDYRIHHDSPALQGGLPWVAVACIRGRRS